MDFTIRSWLLVSDASSTCKIPCPSCTVIMLPDTLSSCTQAHAMCTPSHRVCVHSIPSYATAHVVITLTNACMHATWRPCDAEGSNGVISAVAQPPDTTDAGPPGPTRALARCSSNLCQQPDPSTVAGSAHAAPQHNKDDGGMDKHRQRASQLHDGSSAGHEDVAAARRGAERYANGHAPGHSQHSPAAGGSTRDQDGSTHGEGGSTQLRVQLPPSHLAFLSALGTDMARFNQHFSAYVIG